MYISFLSYYLVVFVCLKFMSIIATVIAEDLIISVRIKENIPIGSVVCNLFDLIVPRPSKHTIYTIMKNQYFSVRDFENVVVIRAIDRDLDSNLCMERHRNISCVWKTILLSSNSAHRILRIVIDDENDNSPSWAKNEVSVNVTENLSPELCSIELPKALDPDETPNNTVLYLIDPPSMYVFIINKTTTNGLTPYLRIRQRLDREILSSHNVTVVAIDGGTPPRSGFLSLIIRIVDVNDNSPQFESSIYTFSLGPHLRVYDQLDLKIRASDADEGPNGNVTYFLSLNTPFPIQNCFGVDPISAVITIKRPLTGQCRLPEYRFTVTASDRGNPVRSHKTNVLLLSDSRNLFAPNIQLSNKEPTITIRENNRIGVPLTTVAVKDKDSGINGQFQCMLKGNNTDKVAIISSKSKVGDLTIMQLVTVGVFDREIETELVLSILCTDLGDPPLSSSETLTILILDENDNNPFFKEKSYHFKIYEENEPYLRLAQLSAFDKDDGNNAILTYHIDSSSLADDVTSRLTIDVNGNIIAKERLDREKFPNGFNFSVIATDQGSPPLSGSADVFLELIDINDNSPSFRQGVYNFTFMEDDSSKHQSRILGHLSAWDPDLHNNSLVSYTISPSVPLPFKLSSESGQLYSYTLIDRDSQSSHYVFSVLAVDSPNNMLYRRTASVTVFVEILDYNDNRPAFVFPNEANNRVQLSYLSPVGTVVTTVKATDKDSGFNSKIVYSLVDPDRNILFSINETSGELIISTVLNSIHEGVENLFIRASDCGSPPLSAIQQLIVEIGEFRLPLPGNSDNVSSNTDPFLSDQATYIIVGIVLGTFFICCGLVTGICTMTYRQWRTSRVRASSSRQYGEEGDPSQLHMYTDNYLEMKEMI